MCLGCFGVGYSADVEIPGDTADSGYGLTNGYSSEYVVTSTVPNGMGMTQHQQYHNDLPSEDASTHAPAMLTYPNHYAPAAAMMTTVPYCPPLVADPYIVPHGGVSYQHQVLSLIHLCTEWRRINWTIYFCCPSSVFLQQNT